MASLADKQRQLYEAEAEAKVDAAAAQEAATAAGTAPAPHDALMGSFEQGTAPPPLTAPGPIPTKRVIRKRDASKVVAAPDLLQAL